MNSAQKKRDWTGKDGIVTHRDVTVIDVDVTISTTDAIASGDYVGTSAAAITFTGAARENNGTGRIVGAALIDGSGATDTDCELWVFDTAVTPPANSAAWSISDAHAKRVVCVIPFATFYASALNNVAATGALDYRFQTLSSSKDLYGCLVTRGAPSWENGSLSLRLYVEQD